MRGIFTFTLLGGCSITADTTTLRREPRHWEVHSDGQTHKEDDSQPLNYHQTHVEYNDGDPYFETDPAKQRIAKFIARENKVRDRELRKRYREGKRVTKNMARQFKETKKRQEDAIKEIQEAEEQHEDEQDKRDEKGLQAIEKRAEEAAEVDKRHKEMLKEIHEEDEKRKEEKERESLALAETFQTRMAQAKAKAGKLWNREMDRAMRAEENERASAADKDAWKDVEKYKKYAEGSDAAIGSGPDVDYINRRNALQNDGAKEDKKYQFTKADWKEYYSELYKRFKMSQATDGGYFNDDDIVPEIPIDEVTGRTGYQTIGKILADQKNRLVQGAFSNRNGKEIDRSGDDDPYAEEYGKTEYGVIRNRLMNQMDEERKAKFRFQNNRIFASNRQTAGPVIITADDILGATRADLDLEGKWNPTGNRHASIRQDVYDARYVLNHNKLPPHLQTQHVSKLTQAERDVYGVRGNGTSVATHGTDYSVIRQKLGQEKDKENSEDFMNKLASYSSSYKTKSGSAGPVVIPDMDGMQIARDKIGVENISSQRARFSGVDHEAIRKDVKAARKMLPA